jgi:tetratricopeptide (TPR) repeat protein
MQLLQKLPFTSHEKSLIKRVLLFSSAGSLGLVALTWAVLWIRPQLQPGTAPPTDLESYYAGNPKLLPIDLEAHREMAAQYAKTNQPRKAIPHLLRILSREPKDRDAQQALGTAYLQAGMYQKAIEAIDQLVAQTGKDSIATALQARHALALFYAQRTRESVTMLEECLRRSPDSPEALCYRGQIEMALDITSPRIEQYFEKAVRLAPRYTEARYQFARYLMNKPDADLASYREARVHLLALLDIEPLNGRAHSRLGMVYYYLQQPRLAESSYRTALALNPDDHNTHYNLGELYLSFYEDEQRALTEYLETIRINPDHADAHFRVGLINLGNDALNEAIDHLVQARNLRPRNVRILFQLAVAYEKKQMLDRAQEVYEAVLKNDPLNRVALQKIKSLTEG